MFWKRWFAKTETPREKGVWGLKTEIISLKSQLEYQTELAKSFRDRVHELEKQVTDKADLGNLYKLAADGYLADIARLETYVADLTASRDEFEESYSRLLEKVTDAISYEYGLDDDEPEIDDQPADSVGEETESDADSHLPTLSSLAGIGLASNDGEETQVFDSRQYGEQ